MNQCAATAQEDCKKIRVLAADSTRMSSQLLAEALAQDTQFEVAHIDAKIAPIVDAVTEQKPHVVLLSADLNGSATAGFEITRQVRDASPDTKIVLMMDAANPGAVVEAFRSGAQGIFSRSESSKALAKCITSVYQGQVWANSAELRYLLQALREAAPVRLVDSRGDAILSKREHDVVQCVAEGLSNREIAGRLKLTEHTVKNYLFRIFDKLGVSSRVEVVLYAFSVRGIVCEPPASNPAPAQAKSENEKAGSPKTKKPAEPANPLAHRARM